MGRERAMATAAAVASRPAAISKHKRRNKYIDHDRAPVRHSRPPLAAKPVAPKLKYQSYFEFQENKEKKKKLEFQVTNEKTPQPGFTFVPVGNPELTKVCKELSREEDALIFVVSTTKEQNHALVEHVHRIGYHFRSYIVDEAAIALGGIHAAHNGNPVLANETDAIPDSQEEINKQADAAIRDLFPRIPNTDREMIIQHAFQKGAVFHGKPVVGLQADLSLSRRVQLAVIAHIRHTHTRYDNLLRETDYQNARRTVEGLSLDILLKWRGDEETGRDQLDEVLREVVVISDSDQEDDSEDEDGDDSDDDVVFISELSTAPMASESSQPRLLPSIVQAKATNMPAPAISDRTRSKTSDMPKGSRLQAMKTRSQRKKDRRRQRAWDRARERGREQQAGALVPIEVNTAPYFQPPKIGPDQHIMSNHPGYIREQQDQRYIPNSEYELPRQYPVAEPVSRRPVERPYGDMMVSSGLHENVYRHLPESSNETRELRVLRAPAAGPSALHSGGLRSEARIDSPRGFRETVLPSIEPIDLSRDSPHSGGTQRSTYQAQDPQRRQVTYIHRNLESGHPRAVPSVSSVFYVDDRDEQSARRRLMLDYDHPEMSDTNRGQTAQRLHPGRPLVSTPLVYTRPADGRERIDVRPRQDMLGHEQIQYLPVDSSRVRGVKRVLEPESSIGKLSLDDPHDRPYSRQYQREVAEVRPRDQEPAYLETARRVPAAHVLTDSSERLPDFDQGHSLSRARPLQGHQSSLSTFPAQSRLHEMGAGPVSAQYSQYQVPSSRAPQEYETRFTSRMNGPGSVDARRPQVLQGRPFIDSSDGGPLYREEPTFRRAEDREVLWDRPRYLQPRESDRPRDMVRRTPPKGFRGPVYDGNIPSPSGVIVLD